MAERKPLSEMTSEEKVAAFEKLWLSRESRKGQSGARRTAVKKLIEAHEAEFKKLMVAAGGKVKVQKE